MNRFWFGIGVLVLLVSIGFYIFTDFEKLYVRNVIYFNGEIVGVECRYNSKDGMHTILTVESKAGISRKANYIYSKTKCDDYQKKRLVGRTAKIGFINESAKSVVVDGKILISNEQGIRSLKGTFRFLICICFLFTIGYGYLFYKDSKKR